MNKTVTPVVLFFLLAIANAAGAQVLSVDEVIARHIDARGGYDKIKAIQTLVYSNGQYREGDYVGDGDATMAFSRPYFRVVGNPKKPEGYLEGYDGAAWEWYEDPGIVVRTVGHAAGATRRGADFEGPLVDYKAKGSRVVLGTAEEIDGRPAYRLIVTLADGFVREYFVDQQSFLITAERRVAPIHAFGAAVTSEDRFADYRPVAGVLFPHASVETDIATGKILNTMQWGRIEANRKLPASWFSPPQHKQSSLQRFLELLFQERTDKEAVLWSYRQFRRAHAGIDTRSGIEAIGYQMLKMGEHDSAIALLEANAQDYPDSSTSVFAVGRAYQTAGDLTLARMEFERALQLDPGNARATRALNSMAAATETVPANPLSFLAPFIGSWWPDPQAQFVLDNPGMADDIAFRFEWADPQKKILRFYEGIPDGDLDRRVLENLATYNPRSSEVIALGYQLQNDFLYESTFEPLDDGYVRLYKVTYPADQQFSRDEDRERGWIRYRDRCQLTGPDRLHCTTEQMRAGQWQFWGSPDGYTLLRSRPRATTN